MKTIAFFGHSNVFNVQEVEKLLAQMLIEVIPNGYSKLLIGCHGEFDKIALSTCINHRMNVNRNIEISVVLTSLSFLNKDKYGYSRADFYKNKGAETIFYDIENVYFKNRITYSNKKMIDDSDLIICFVDMKSYKSGAKSAINYALTKGKPIINLFEILNKLNQT